MVAGFAVLLVIAYVISLVSTKGLETPLSKEDAERKQSNVFKSMFSTMKAETFQRIMAVLPDLPGIGVPLHINSHNLMWIY